MAIFASALEALCIFRRQDPFTWCLALLVYQYTSVTADTVSLLGVSTEWAFHGKSSETPRQSIENGERPNSALSYVSACATHSRQSRNTSVRRAETGPVTCMYSYFWPEMFLTGSELSGSV